MRKRVKDSEYLKKIKESYTIFAKEFTKDHSKQCPVISYRVHWQYENKK